MVSAHVNDRVYSGDVNTGCMGGSWGVQVWAFQQGYVCMYGSNVHNAYVFYCYGVSQA